MPKQIKIMTEKTKIKKGFQLKNKKEEPTKLGFTLFSLIGLIFIGLSLKSNSLFLTELVLSNTIIGLLLLLLLNKTAK